MKSFESVYKELEDLFIKQLPDYIEKVNKAHNDGIILKPFENTTLEEECLRTPCYEILFPLPVENNIILLYRYFEAIDTMLEEIESERIYRITQIKENKIMIQITD